jgi:hypothetical protein
MATTISEPLSANEVITSLLVDNMSMSTDQLAAELHRRGIAITRRMCPTHLAYAQAAGPPCRIDACSHAYDEDDSWLRGAAATS